MIELKDISKTYVERNWRTLLPGVRPRNVEALRGVSLNVEEGEIVGLLGPNGAGKTTLIKILVTLVLPDHGSGKVQGFDLIRQPEQVRSLIGFVNTSERSFYWRLSGRRNLLFFAALWGLNGSAANARINKILDLLQLSEKADVLFMKYSTGQQQRLAIARALIPDPPVLLMDEPTRSLDPIAAFEIRSFVRQDLCGQMQKTIVWCTHNLKEAEETCNRLVFIHKGKIIASGTLDEMRNLTDPENYFYVKADRFPEKVLQEKLSIQPIEISRNNGSVEAVFKVVPDRIPDLLRQLLDRGVNIYTFTHRQASLENIFEKLVRHD